MQHEAMVELDRAAEVHRLVREPALGERDLDLAEERGEGDVDGPVHHDAQRAAFVVLANEGEGSGKIRVRHRGHRDEEVAGQVDRLHGPPERILILTPGWAQIVP
jgi:hypothetical protein